MKNQRPLNVRGFAGLAKELPRLHLWICALLMLLVMRLVRPLALIRIGAIPSNRIGHLAITPELYLRQMAAGIARPNGRYIDLFYYKTAAHIFEDGLPANTQLAEMWKKHIRIWPAWLLSRVEPLNARFGAPIHVGVVQSLSSQTLDVHGLLENSTPTLIFTSEEELRGQGLMRDLGIPAGADFVCIAARDNAYLDTVAPYDWSFYDYRNCNINNFMLAAEALAALGVFVVRLGTYVEASFDSDNSHIIDYSNSEQRSPFMDIYLSAKCLFCVSSPTGIAHVPVIFHRPVVFVNCLPYYAVTTDIQNTLVIFKKLYDSVRSITMTFTEVLAYERSYGFRADSSNFKKDAIEIVENTPEEIRDVTLEMYEHLENNWRDITTSDELQDSFWRHFPVAEINGSFDYPLHGSIRSRVGKRFLESHASWIIA